ncbi:hypothetical protein ES705_21410 [subsurface metagenome]
MPLILHDFGLVYTADNEERSHRREESVTFSPLFHRTPGEKAHVAVTGCVHHSFRVDMQWSHLAAYHNPRDGIPLNDGIADEAVQQIVTARLFEHHEGRQFEILRVGH